MKYIAYLVQKGEGCDYTIGCGLQVLQLDVNNMVESKIKLSKIIKEEYVDDEELETAKIFEVSDSFKMDLNYIYSNIKKPDKEYEEYLRLKKKYE